MQICIGLIFHICASGRLEFNLDTALPDVAGKDPSKVDRSGAYVARQAAKSVVASGLARRCLFQVNTHIGPVSRILKLLAYNGNFPTSHSSFQLLMFLRTHWPFAF